jgi:transposase
VKSRNDTRPWWAAAAGGVPPAHRGDTQRDARQHRQVPRRGQPSRGRDGAGPAPYAGIAPVTHHSGFSIRGEHPARSGNRKLKRAFFLAAFAALSDPTSRAYYDRKRAEGKKHNAALICLARRRCDVLYAMLRTNTHYQPPTLRAA